MKNFSTWADIPLALDEAARGSFTWYEVEGGGSFATCSVSGNAAKIAGDGDVLTPLIVRDVLFLPSKWCEEGQRCLDVSCPLNKTTDATLEKEYGKGIPPSWRKISEKLGRSLALATTEEKPARSKVNGHETRAIRAARTPLKPRTRWRILTRDGFRCCVCGRTPNDGITLHVDHVVPVSKGGSNQDDNLQTLCQDCNLGKGVITHRVMHS